MAPSSVEAYLESLSPAAREVLEQVRSTIRVELPDDATEKISYSIPAFAVDGKVVIFFAGWAKHVSVYPVPVGTEAFQRKVAPYVTGRGTVSFPLADPLPIRLIGEIARTSLREHRAREKAKLAAKAKPKASPGRK